MHKTMNLSNDFTLKQDCQTAVRALEFEAYSLILTAFRARGIVDEDRLDALDHLRDILKLSINRHNSELRRICDDPDLGNLALSVNNGTDQWAGGGGDFMIGRFFDQSDDFSANNIDDQQSAEYRHAFKSLADDLQSLTSRHNRKLTVNKQQQQKQLNKKRKSESEYKPHLKYQRNVNEQQPQFPACFKTTDKVNKIIDSVANSSGPVHQQRPIAANSSHVTNQFQQQAHQQLTAPPIGQMIAAAGLPPAGGGQNSTAATVLVACGQRYFVMPSFFLQNSSSSACATSPPVVTTGQSSMFSPPSSSHDPGQPLFRAPSSF